jgi:D-3-phosphoglycerate dehydrogenase
MKKGVRIINCARGGLWTRRRCAPRSIRTCRRRGLRCVHDRARDRKSAVRHPNVICTPHLGAATSEAQENVALQVAEQMSEYLLRGAISNAW